jgi:hypothetical protein
LRNNEERPERSGLSFQMDFHLAFLKRFQFLCLLVILVELLVSHPCGKQTEHSFLQYSILETWTFDILAGKSISPNSFTPKAFCICFCLFIKSLIRLNLMQSSFDSVFKIFHGIYFNSKDNLLYFYSNSGTHST